MECVDLPDVRRPWDSWKSPEDEAVGSCTIVATNPNEFILPIHNRMPPILPSETESSLISLYPLSVGINIVKQKTALVCVHYTSCGIGISQQNRAASVCPRRISACEEES